VGEAELEVRRVEVRRWGRRWLKMEVSGGRGVPFLAFIVVFEFDFSPFL